MPNIATTYHTWSVSTAPKFSVIYFLLSFSSLFLCLSPSVSWPRLFLCPGGAGSRECVRLCAELRGNVASGPVRAAKEPRSCTGRRSPKKTLPTHHTRHRSATRYPSRDSVSVPFVCIRLCVEALTLPLLCAEDSTTSVVSRQVSAQLCLSQVESILSCCHSNNPLTCLPPGSDNDLRWVSAVGKTTQVLIC